jgi:patatin-related protein
MRAASEARAEQNGNVRELRLGVVCYGGVSLAIYMHGITKELQKLVVASRGFENHPTVNPFPAHTVENAYWEILRRAHDADPDGVLTKVVIDVVAGTSAGGINGVIMCKALAHNLSQDPLRHLWFVKADIKQLLGGSAFREFLDLAELAVELPFNKAKPPLDGNAMLGWLLDALDDVDRTPPAYRPGAGEADCPSLLPDGHQLQLFVTTTDYYGYRQFMPIASPPVVAERRNRHILEFDYLRESGRVERDQFDAAHNVALGFAARCTSSFPGAFPPLDIAGVEQNLARFHRPPLDEAAFKRAFFRAYELSQADAGKTFFIDGGVLANYPFRPAIEAIVGRRSEAEVVRRLIYLQPDPGGEIANPEGKTPTLFGTVWAGLSTIAGSQPILDELVYVRDFNARVRRTQEIVEQARVPIAEILESDLGISLGASLDEIPQETLAADRQAVEREAEVRAGYAYTSYFQIRVHSIVEQFAAAISTVCEYTTANLENNLGYFVGLIVEEWAQRAGLFGDRASLEKQRDLLRRFDVGFLRRRLAFVIQGINELYGKPGAPDRIALNLAKAALYDGIDELSGLIDSRSVAPALRQRVVALFPQEELFGFLAAPSLAARVESFVDRAAGDLEQVFQQVGDFLLRRQDEIYHKLYEDFRRITAGWAPERRREVLIRFLGFPFWDTLIYPVTRLTQAGELREIDVVRFSPADSTALGAATAQGKSTPQKLLGVKLAHFGAFFSREARENDYLWGRLDAAERLVGLLLGQPTPGDLKPVLAAIVAEEESGAEPLTAVKPLLAKIKSTLAAIPDPPPVARPA